MMSKVVGLYGTIDYERLYGLFYDVIASRYRQGMLSTVAIS